VSVGRISRRFSELAAADRAGLVTFVTAGDPNLSTSSSILAALPAAGADIIELGMPFSDPMADGPAIQASSLRALRQGQTLRRTLAMVSDFRKSDQTTPIVLMGYFNPIYIFGVEAFVRKANEVGVDGIIVVDLPPEEADELRRPAEQAGLDLIFLTAPTTTEERLETVLRHARGFIYHVSILGITGTDSARAADVEKVLARLRRKTKLPIAVGFGIKTPTQAAEMARRADAAVVGSVLVTAIAKNLDANDHPTPDIVNRVSELVSSLSKSVREARRRKLA
jgi:tryptophan synthase alpha chain